MKYFPDNIKPTVGSRLREPPNQIISDADRLRVLLSNHKEMQKDKLGQIFDPLTGSRIRDLVQKTKQTNENLQ